MQADIAQEVERSIGSAEVTGPTPVISFNKKSLQQHLFAVTRIFYGLSKLNYKLFYISGATSLNTASNKVEKNL